MERYGHDDVLGVRCVEVDDAFELCDAPSWDFKPVFRSIWSGNGDWFDE